MTMTNMTILTTTEVRTVSFENHSVDHDDDSANNYKLLETTDVADNSSC